MTILKDRFESEQLQTECEIKADTLLKDALN